MEPKAGRSINDPPLGEFAGEVLKDLHRAIICHEVGVLEGDVEAIHDMRVGIRRIRNAMSNFSSCLSKDDRKGMEDTLKNLAESLGRVRDVDVLIASLKSHKSKIEAGDHEALRALIKRTRARRRRNMKTLSKYIRGPEFEALKNLEVGKSTTATNSESNGETV